MLINTKHRTDAVEIMDDFALEGNQLRDALDKIASINQFLGGNTLTLKGLQLILKLIPKDNKITIVDIGCGNGDMLRVIANYAKENNYSFNLIGIDANPFTISHAKDLSRNYPTISYQCIDVFDTSFDDLKYDILLCTLTLHHFKDDEILKLMSKFYKKVTIGIVINDLHRSSISYRLFQVLCSVFRLNEMSREDGLVSILRGFKKIELEHFSKKLQFKNYSIQWKWAFRYQWIIMK
jgi:2-polyprenyl-3-methyl-5-hydroxy-6-metoxy-1,4-benzoquinol methylase